MPLPGHVPPGFRRVGIPRGATVTVRAKRAGTPILAVEGPDGADLLEFTVGPDGRLDAQYKPERLTEAARLLLGEVRQLLGAAALDPFIQIAADSPAQPPTRP